MYIYFFIAIQNNMEIEGYKNVRGRKLVKKSTTF